ncbi:protein kinase [Stenotrophomonas sp.]|uniref:protein kinase n=1 Tax=Stenotrophomonas sp. TaxID=69392 RepID=UPI0028AEDC46|nr:protein kinase [Stenotrophomonas sp.]
MTGPDRWQTVRGLFDAVCDLPEARWRPALGELCDDPAAIDETLQLLRAQTADLGRVEHALAAVMAAMDDPATLVGQRLGPWRLSRLLAVGGMGVVFLAERADALYRREVAIKLIRRAYDPVLATRLASESQILADLQHPHIARLYDVGVAEGGQPYLVMEYVQGEPLDDACRTLSLDLAARLRPVRADLRRGPGRTFPIRGALRPQARQRTGPPRRPAGPAGFRHRASAR